MIRDLALQTREKLVDKLPVTGELLRGSLLERTVRHKSGCPKGARGEGHQVYVLTVSYAGGRVRQLRAARARCRGAPLAGQLPEAEAVVPQRPEMADRMRGTHQRGQTAARARSLPL